VDYLQYWSTLSIWLKVDRKLTEGTFLTNRDIIKGLRRNIYSLRDQSETNNFFKGLKY
jgi:hypothetical protein